MHTALIVVAAMMALTMLNLGLIFLLQRRNQKGDWHQASGCAHATVSSGRDTQVNGKAWGDTRVSVAMKPADVAARLRALTQKTWMAGTPWVCALRPPCVFFGRLKRDGVVVYAAISSKSVACDGVRLRVSAADGGAVVHVQYLRGIHLVAAGALVVVACLLGPGGPFGPLIPILALLPGLLLLIYHGLRVKRAIVQGLSAWCCDSAGAVCQPGSL